MADKDNLTLVESLRFAEKVDNWRIINYDWKERPLVVSGEIDKITVSVAKLTPFLFKKLGPYYNLRVWGLSDYEGLRCNSVKDIYEKALEKISTSPNIPPKKESRESLLARAREIIGRDK